MSAIAELPTLLRSLRLPTIGNMWQSLLAQAEAEQWSHARYLSVLCEHEANERESKRIARFTRESGLPISKTITSFEYAVIILDDIGYVQKNEAETHVLFELISYRYESGSLIVTSNQPFSGWEGIFPDSSMTVVAIDRLVHHSIILNIQAQSFRKRYAESHNNQ